MPNWCQNEVNVYGTEAEIDIFKEFVKSKELYHGRCSETSNKKFNSESDKWEWIDKDVYCQLDDDFKDTCDKVQEPLDFNSILPMPIILEGTSSPPHVYDTQEEVDAYNKDRHPIAGKAITKDQLNEIRQSTGHTNWYDWSIDNWGVKWNCGEIQFEDEGDHLMFAFDTPWCPPYGIYNKLVEEFPDIQISWFYKEEGEQFAGYLPN